MGILKWLFLSGLGYAIGGPIGLLIAQVVTLLSDGLATALPPGDNTDAAPTGQRTYTRRATQGDIRVSILVLVACVLKADGIVRKSELNVVKKYLLQTYGEEAALEALQVLKKLLEQNIDHIAVATQIRQNVNYSTRLTILQFLLNLAYADGVYAPSEERLIEQISATMGLSDSDYRSLLAVYGKAQSPDWAYQALEITASATNEEVKKAYRRMAMKYHPDKVAAAGEDVKQKANEKFRAINEAYEKIKKERGIN